MIYTAVDYLYRDAANYKIFGEFWLLGGLTDDEFQSIRDACEGGDLFVPEQLGLKSLLEDLIRASEGTSASDHGWHELISKRIEKQLPDDQYIWGDKQDFLQRFLSLKNRWNPTEVF